MALLDGTFPAFDVTDDDANDLKIDVKADVKSDLGDGKKMDGFELGILGFRNGPVGILSDMVRMPALDADTTHWHTHPRLRRLQRMATLPQWAPDFKSELAAVPNLERVLGCAPLDPAIPETSKTDGEKLTRDRSRTREHCANPRCTRKDVDDENLCVDCCVAAYCSKACRTAHRPTHTQSDGFRAPPTTHDDSAHLLQPQCASFAARLEVATTAAALRHLRRVHLESIDHDVGRLTAMARYTVKTDLLAGLIAPVLLDCASPTTVFEALDVEGNRQFRRLLSLLAFLASSMPPCSVDIIAPQRFIRPKSSPVASTGDTDSDDEEDDDADTANQPTQMTITCVPWVVFAMNSCMCCSAPVRTRRDLWLCPRCCIRSCCEACAPHVHCDECCEDIAQALVHALTHSKYVFALP